MLFYPEWLGTWRIQIYSRREALGMKVLSLMLLLAGWFLVLASIVLLASPLSRTGFIFTAIAVEILGLIFLFRSHAIPREGKG